MRVTFLLRDSGISARTRLVAAQADALITRGHKVRIVSPSLPMSWRSSEAEWIDVDDLSLYLPDPGEVVLDERFAGIRSHPIVDQDFYRSIRPSENRPLRVLLAGPSQAEDKGLGEGYGAVAHARWFHQPLELVRVSPFAPSRQEPLDDVQEFHVGLSAPEMTRLVHSCDILVAPNRRADPLSLTTLEALAAGLACLVTLTPEHEALGVDCALFGPPDNAVELGERLIELLADRQLRQRLRAGGRAVAEQWRAATVAPLLESLLSAPPPSPAQ